MIKIGDLVKVSSNHFNLNEDKDKLFIVIEYNDNLINLKCVSEKIVGNGGRYIGISKNCENKVNFVLINDNYNK